MVRKYHPIQVQFRWMWIAFSVICGLFTPVWGQDDAVAGDVQLIGTLGEKLKIEMLLGAAHEKAFFTNSSKECIDLEGSYFYRTQLLPIRLQGRLCPANGTFFLAAKSGDTETERFEGKWDVPNRQLNGTWTLKSNGKTMPFTLTATELAYSDATMRGYYSVLRELLATEPDAEGARIDDAQWENKSGKIIGFAPNWGGDITFLSPTRFAYYTSYNSTARGSDYMELYQLLPSVDMPYVLHFSNSTHFEKSYEKEEDFEENLRCDYSVTVYRWENGGAVDVTTDVFPSGISLNGGDQDPDGSGCDANVLSNAILLPNGVALYWNGSAFVKTN